MNYRCKRCLCTGIMWLLLSFKWSIVCHQVIKLRQKLNRTVAAVRLQQQEWGNIRQDAGEKMGVGRAWESAMKKACQHYLFYWFNSKGLPLKLYVALAGSIENTATNKKRFPKKLERFHLFIFYFYLLPIGKGFAWIFVKVSPSSSLWVTVKVRPRATLLSLPKASMALRRARSSSTGQQ